METTIEKNKEMTAQESLSLITETLNNSRREISNRSGKYFILWGLLLAVFSLAVYLPWKATEAEAWNLLWFAMPVVGYVFARLMRKKDEAEPVQNDISRIVRGIWTTFGVFACAVGAFTFIFTQLDDNLIRLLAAGVGMTAEIVLLFGLAECISGVALKNWAIKIAGLVTGIGGLAIYYIMGAAEEQMFIFTFAGLVLVVTGLIVKSQYK